MTNQHATNPTTAQSTHPEKQTCHAIPFASKKDAQSHIRATQAHRRGAKKIDPKKRAIVECELCGAYHVTEISKAELKRQKRAQRRAEAALARQQRQSDTLQHANQTNEEPCLV